MNSRLLMKIFVHKLFKIQIICLFSRLFSQHELPSLKCSEEHCIADFILWKDGRLKNPGGCSLEFQSIMQILTECLLKWDIKTKSSTGKGILGTVLAFAGAHEEQGCKTLHRHWQIWVKELSQTLRNSLCHKNVEIKDKARRKFCGIIDKVVCASYGQEVCITHRCVDQNNTHTMKHVGSST